MSGYEQDHPENVDMEAVETFGREVQPPAWPPEEDVRGFDWENLNRVDDQFRD